MPSRAEMERFLLDFLADLRDDLREDLRTGFDAQQGTTRWPRLCLRTWASMAQCSLESTGLAQRPLEARTLADLFLEAAERGFRDGAETNRLVTVSRYRFPVGVWMTWMAMVGARNDGMDAHFFPRA